LDIVALELDRLGEGFDRLFGVLQTEQGVAQISQGDRKIWSERERLFVAGTGFAIELEIVQCKTEIAMSVCRALVEGDRALKDPLGVLEPFTFEDRDAEQMHRVKIIGLVPQHAPAKRLRILVPALSIGGESSQQSLRLFPEFLLLLRAWQGASASGALQGHSPGESVLRIYHE